MSGHTYIIAWIVSVKVGTDQFETYKNFKVVIFSLIIKQNQKQINIEKVVFLALYRRKIFALMFC